MKGGNQVALEGLGLSEAARAAGTTAWTLRGWMKAGLLVAPPFRGPSTRYDAGFVERARTIVGWRKEGLRLEAIAARLAQPPVAVEKAAPLVATVATAPAAEPAWRKAGWSRIELVPGLELHVAEGAGEVLLRLAQEIWTKYGLR